jgi:predicted RNA-binding Zn ribbon-like protein
MKPLLLAGHPALEFLNTAMAPNGAPIELIGDGNALLEWFVSAGLLDPAAAAQLRRRCSAAAFDEVAAEARKVRSWAAGWLTRWRANPDARYEPELRRLNELLMRANDYRQLTRDHGELAIVERRRGDDAAELIGVIAVQIADLLVNTQASLVKRCEGAECTLWFVDRTKAHRRRFCSATACGNRDKVAAFRARQRRPS